MITFLFFKMLMLMYSFDKSTVDTCSGVFAFISFIEFICVLVSVIVYFRDIVTFTKGLFKK